MKKLLNKRSAIFIALLVVVVVFVLFSQTVWADGESSDNRWAHWLVGGIARAIVSVLGWVLAKLMGILIYVAQYNNFIHSAVISHGWTVARDVANMFFVVILLIIAFATILRIESYNYKKWLPKLILMAILINFSKTICGLLIDISQVVMLTFVNAFSEIGAGNLTKMLGIADWQSLKGVESISNWEIAAAYVLAVIYAFIALVTVAAMVAMLVMRIIMIWVYVVLSPFAYLLSAFPGGTGYASQWWKEFTKNLIVGPVLAFFIWLSFVSLGLPSDNDYQVLGEFSDKSGEENIQVGDKDMKQYGTSNLMIQFIVAIAMLLGGMKIAQEIGGASGSMAGKAFGKVKGLGLIGAGVAGGLAWKGAKQPFSWGADKLQEKGIVDLKFKRAWDTMMVRRKQTKDDKFVSGLAAAGERQKKGGFAGLLAMTAGPADAWDKFTDWKGIKPTGVIKQLKGDKKLLSEQQVIKDKKSIAEQELDNQKFENKFMNTSVPKRQEMLDDSISDKKTTQESKDNAKKEIKSLSSKIKAEEAKGKYKDKELLDGLYKSRAEEKQTVKQAEEKEKIITKRIEFAKAGLNKDFTNKEKFESRQKVKDAQASVDYFDRRISDTMPQYNRQARLAEQASVNKKMGELQDISDPSELTRMLKASIAAHDKNMIKAVMLKLTKDANDNEALTPLAGRSDYIGLQNLMRQFSDKKSNNYAGFNQQEAFSLGAQVAELNKATNHWAATSAYVMDNGIWRETTDEEHNEIRDVETGKQQLQAFIRNNNRLAYGYHDVTGKFHLDVGGIMKLKAINNMAGLKNLETMNESAAKHVWDALHEKGNEKLLDEFKKMVPKGTSPNDTLYYALGRRLGDISSVKNSKEKYNSAKSYIT